MDDESYVRAYAALVAELRQEMTWMATKLARQDSEIHTLRERIRNMRPKVIPDFKPVLAPRARAVVGS